MIVYREARREAEPREELDALERLAAARDAAGLLVGVGEVEQGIADALRPFADGWSDAEAELREAAWWAAAALIRRGDPAAVDDALRRVRAALAALRARPLPHRIRIRPPEGFVHYALDPAGYAAAAAAYRSDAGPARAARAVVLGIRSIGTALSAVVAARLGSRRSVTLRPRGGSGERRIAVDDALYARLAAWLREGDDVLIVDEGPGATGETLEAVARWVASLGVEERRIVLFPSRPFGLPIAPESRRAWFAAVRKYPPPVGDARPARIASRLGLAMPRDLSGGRWRETVAGGGRLPACTVHERCKHLARDARGTPFLLRFAGLGRWGEATVARAARLADAGAGPEVVAFDEGFLVQRWTEGAPVGRDAARDPAFLVALDGYLRARAPRFRTGRAAPVEPLVAMLRANAAEELGAGAAGLGAALRALERLPPGEASVTDARPHAHEWLRTADGYRKVDALDHGDGLRLPGPVDHAWDLAGAAVEFGLDRATLGALADGVAAACGDRPRRVRAAADVFRPAYAALQLGEARLAAREAEDGHDRLLLEAQAARYRAALAAELDRAATAPVRSRAA